jgi:phosphate:Na+ symporter
MGGFLRGLLDKSMSPQTSERVMNLQNRQSLIEYIEEALYELVRTARGTPHSGALDPLVRRFAEGLDFMLRLAGRTLADPESEERELLGMLCGDRGELMEKIRKAYAAGPQELTAQDRALLFSLTGMFERVVWMVNRLARLLGHTVREGD